MSSRDLRSSEHEITFVVVVVFRNVSDRKSLENQETPNRFVYTQTLEGERD